jgi:hypothetical protein
MKITELKDKLKYEELCGGSAQGIIEDGYTSDLLSDVMGNAPEDSVLITIQAHKNTVAVASLAGISTILLCNNRPAPDDMLKAAEQEEVAVYRCQDNQFTASWRIHQLLEG